MTAAEYTTNEIMTIAAARLLKNGAVCFVGIGLPSTAANLARLTHAPDIVLIYESGPIGAKPAVLPLSIGDGNLAETADTVVSTPEIFRYWLQGGRVDVGFLGAAQIDRFANINTTVIGDYGKPSTRLPGAGGAPEIRQPGRPWHRARWRRQYRSTATVRHATPAPQRRRDRNAAPGGSRQGARRVHPETEGFATTVSEKKTAAWHGA